MAYVPVYESRINWQNFPVQDTPLNAQNLNKLDYAVYEHDKSFKQIFDNSIKRIDYNTSTKTFLFTYWNGTTEEINLALEQIPASFTLDKDGVVHMIDDQGNEYTADLKDHIYYIDSVEIQDEGTATDTTYARKVIVVNDTIYEVPGSKYMEQEVQLSAVDMIDVEFINDIFLNDDIVIDVYTSKDDLLYSAMYVADNSCHVIFDRQEEAFDALVKIYIK